MVAVVGNSYSESVFQVLREEILTGRQQPGDRLRELELAERMGTSQGPIREALARLREQRLIYSIPHRGSFVAEVTADEARDAAEVRRVLEPYATARALPNLDERAFAILESDVERIVAAARRGDLAENFFHDMAFHRRIFEWSGSQALVIFWSQIEAITRKFVMVTAPRVFRDPEAIAESHYRLIERMRAGDVAGLNEALDIHIMRIWRELDEPPVDGPAGEWIS